MGKIRAEHKEQIERWAEYVRTHTDWKQKLRPFLDSQIIMSRRFYRNLAQTPQGREKIKLLRDMRISK